MSDILIKGMEMPKSCWDCYFQDCGNCRLNSHKVVDKCIIEDRRDEDCPLVHVPPHGRLIDGDAFEDFIRKDWDKNDHWIADVVYSRPTIIPADPAEEGE